MDDLPTLPFALWLFTVLLIGRVLGQLLVVMRAPRWLPPMAQWQSGLVPYPVLLAVQAVVVSLMLWISIDVSRRAGYWFEPHPRLGLVVLWWSYLYAGAMAMRYIVRMRRRPAQRWLGGSIPIVFHTVVAAFQWTFAIYHLTPR
jgi:hypothetical protein